MKATNYARASYQEVYDIMTKDGKVSIFGFHTPTGLGPYKMLSGFFRQFRKYKYSGMSASIIPAAQLPADPLQISYAAGTENYIDPRDLQNPILFHGAHGNNLGVALNRIYATAGKFGIGTSGDLIEMENDDGVQSGFTEGTDVPYTISTIEEWYYTAMLDPSFRKFNVMSNIKLPSMHPRVHSLATDLRLQSHMDPRSLGQLDPISSVLNDSGGIEVSGITDIKPVINVNGEREGTSGISYYNDSVPMKFMSGKTFRLGWLDTFTFRRDSYAEGSEKAVEPVISVLPKLFMGVLVMPPSYRTQLCFRMVLTHYFEFGGFNTAITVPNFIDDDGLTIYDVDSGAQFDLNYHNWLPDSLTETTAVSNSVDAINGEVKQTVSGVM